jgi:hypothetical protein
MIFLSSQPMDFAAFMRLDAAGLVGIQTREQAGHTV